MFQLDIVLGAFAAGFILRYVIPEGDHELESKLDAIGYGFLIPVFFVVSGAKIDLAGVGENPLLLVLFICALLLVRAVPIVVALSLGKGEDKLSMHNRITVALYCTTALPLIVAVTSVAVKAGAMAQDVAGTLVAAGAVTVFLMPFLASLTYRVVDAKPIVAVQEIAAHPNDIRTILHEHLDMERMMVRQEAAARLAMRSSESKDEDIPWQEAAFALQRKKASASERSTRCSMPRHRTSLRIKTRSSTSSKRDPAAISSRRRRSNAKSGAKGSLGRRCASTNAGKTKSAA